MEKKEKILKIIEEFCKKECKPLIKLCEGCILCKIIDTINGEE